MANLTLIITGLGTGGAEMMLLKVLERIDRRRFAPRVISLLDKGEIGPRIEALGIAVDSVGMRRGSASLLGFLKLLNLVRRQRPDIVQTWMYHADLLGGLAARLAGVRAVGWGVHHSNLDPNLNAKTTLSVVKMCARISRSVPRRILACSKRSAHVHELVGYRGDKIVVIPNGFDLTRFRPDPTASPSVRTELGLDNRADLVGLVGRYHPQKNIEGFIDAAGRVLQERANVEFLLVGNALDNENRPLVAAVSRTNHPEKFHLLGRRDDVPRLMAALDLAVSSSHGEGFPNVIGEAMACGVPCVVTDVGDCAEIVGETGLVVPAGEMERLSQAVLNLLGLPERERKMMGRRARDRVRVNFDIEYVVRRYEDFYMSLLEAGRKCVE